MTAGRWTLVDGHVHVHRQFSAPQLLDAAARNLDAAAKQLGAGADCMGVLLLAESTDMGWFDSTFQLASAGAAQLGSWSLHRTPEAVTLIARNAGNSRTLLLVSGRQIVTAERIEVLALLTRSQFLNGWPLEKTLDVCHAAGALVVLPWGVGKWLGRRGRLVRRALARHTGARPVLVGDNGGRPWFWPRPRIFAAAESCGSAVLPGTDPLPLRDQVSRVGSFGLALAGSLPLEAPAAVLRDSLIHACSRASAQPFGKPERATRFLRNQIRLRLRSEAV